MPPNPAKISGITARGMARADRQKEQQSPFDVWTNTGEGISADHQAFFSDPSGYMESARDGIARQNAAMSDVSQWERSSVSEAWDATKAAASATGDAFGKIAEADGALATTGAVFATLTSLEQTVSTMFSAIPFPAFPAVRVMDTAVGLPHAHAHPPNLIPPAPPVPFPSAGPVIPIPYVSGAATVLINNMPAGRCGDMGMGIWCGGYFPMYEIFLGSSSVWLEGARAARVAIDITKHCVFTTPKPSDPPIGPMVGTTVSSSPNVLIGGIPMPSLTGLAVGKAFKAVFKGVGKLKSLAKAADDVAEEAGEATGKFSRARHMDEMAKAKRPPPVKSSGRWRRPDGRISGRRFAGSYRTQQLARARAMGIEVIENADDVLDNAGMKNAAAAFNWEDGAILLRSDASRYEFFHEMQHAEHWIELGRDPDAYRAVGRYGRERRVYDRIMDNNVEFNPYEVQHAKDYINDLGDAYGHPHV